MKFAGFDIETAGKEQEYALQPWRVPEGDSWITLSCAYYAGKRIVKTDQHHHILHDLKVIGKPVATWNGIFDLAFLHADGYDLRGIPWIDAMLLWKFLDNGQNMPMRWDLKSGAKRFLKDWPKLEEFIALKDEELPDASDPYWAERVSLDAEATALIADTIWPQLTPQQQNLAKIQAVSIPMFAKSWVNGIRVDIDAIEAARPGIIRNMLIQEEKLDLVELGSDEDNYTPSKILRSPVKMRKLLYEDYGLVCTRFTDKGAKSTDKAALTYLADDDERVNEIMVWRKYNTILSKFINTPIEACEYLGSDVTHASPRMFATYTKRGSFSSKSGKKKVGVALHQLPRGKEIRSYILAHTDKEFVVEFDVMAQEARWMAVMSQDPNLLKLFKSKAPFNDVHSFMASKIAGTSFEALLDRKKAKDPEVVGAKGLRNTGKFCIAEGQLVDTDSGPIPIEQVSLDNKVWDGIEFVKHDGLVCNGLRTVILRDGVEGTPDHKVLTDRGQWITLEEVLDEISITTMQPRQLQGYAPRPERNFFRQVGDHLSQIYTKGQLAICRLSMCLRNRSGDYSGQLKERCLNSVQTMLRPISTSTYHTLSPAIETIPCGEQQVQQSERPILQELRRARNKNAVHDTEGLRSIYCGDLREGELSKPGHRSKGQRRSLRARKSSGRNQSGESPKQKDNKYDRVSWAGCVFKRSVALAKTGLSKLLLLQRACKYIACAGGIDHRATLRSGQAEAVQGTKKITYDILNAGPRNRFTIQGKVVSNCNLAFNYRSSPATARRVARVDYDIDVSIGQVAQWKQIFTQTYTGIPAYWKSAPKLAKAQGYAETLAGNRYKITKWKEFNWMCSSSAINFPIQGISSDQKELAMAILVTTTPDIEDRLMLEMHDALHLSIPGGYSMRYLLRINKILDDIAYEQYWGFKPPIDFPWEGSLGPNEGSKIDFGYDANPDITIRDFYRQQKEVL